MYVNLNPNTMGINPRDFNHLISLAKAGGFGGVDLPNHLLGSCETASEAGAMLRAEGLEWGLFWLPIDFSNAHEDDVSRAMDWLVHHLPIVKAAGCTRCYNHIWPGSDSLPFDDNMEVHVGRFRMLAALLESYGVSLGIEFIGPKTLRDNFKHPFIHDIKGVAQLIDAIGCGSGFVIDFFHLYTSGGGVDDLRQTVSGRKIVNVHANDARKGRTREEQMDMERELPLATGVIDAASIVGWLKEEGYDGPVIVEPFEPAISRFRGMEPEAVAVEAGGLLKLLIASAPDYPFAP